MSAHEQASAPQEKSAAKRAAAAAIRWITAA
jgi:hypothetical protein